MAEANSPDIFVSYARSAEPHAKIIAQALRDGGYSVWWDDDLPAHRPYSEVIEERLNSAKAVLVVWSREGARSEWVRAEADAARHARKLVQVSVDGVIPPMPFNQIQCPVLGARDGIMDEPTWRKIEGSIAELLGGARSEAPIATATRPGIRRTAICVLPFVNMSQDAEQEYFSDGITEDLIADLSKISALGVVARNTSFTFKGKPVEARSLGRELDVSHILEGSVRKSGNRLRITAQLIDTTTGQHLWAERYDRELADIFDIQDELSKAIVGALKLKLLPAEKKALADRGTANAEAYNLYLMARQHAAAGNDGDWDREELMIRICERAIDIDPDYAHAWALKAIAQTHLRFRQGKAVDGLPAAERALALNPDLAEAHAVKAWYLLEQERADEANEEIAMALRLDPDSWDVNKVSAKVLFLQGRYKEAAACYDKAAELMEADYHTLGMLECCYRGLGDREAQRDAARRGFERVEKALESNPRDAAAVGNGAMCLAVLGEKERAKEWAKRAMALEPENYILRYNMACSFVTDLGDPERALDLIEDSLTHLGRDHVRHTQADPDIASLHDHPRFKQMIADAKKRLNYEETAG